MRCELGRREVGVSVMEEEEVEGETEADYGQSV